MPPRTDDDFWETAKDWSQRKHLILGYYLIPASAKLRSASPDGRVIVVDGFAGRGQYEDGTPGSPILLGRLADECRTWRNPVELRIFNIESDERNFQELQSHTDPWARSGVTQNLSGTFQQWLAHVLKEAGRSPLFAFLDPFCPTGLLFSDFDRLLVRSFVTELFFVFHTPAVYRVIQAVKPEAQTADDTKRQMRTTLDRIFGSRRWQELLSRPVLNLGDVVQPFMEELVTRSTSRHTYVASHAIRTQYAGAVKYHVVFLTRHPAGLRLMNDAFCKETQVAYEQTGRADQLSLELDVAAPSAEMPLALRIDLLVHTLTGVGMKYPDRIWKRSDLIFESIRQRFGEFPETEHRQAVKDLVGRASPPRLVLIQTESKRAARGQTNDQTLMRFDL